LDHHGILFGWEEGENGFFDLMALRLIAARRLLMKKSMSSVVFRFDENEDRGPISLAR
jgi:hypothetical protein